jgi:hypothetical protein
MPPGQDNDIHQALAPGAEETKPARLPDGTLPTTTFAEEITFRILVLVTVVTPLS